MTRKVLKIASLAMFGILVFTSCDDKETQLQIEKMLAKNEEYAEKIKILEQRFEQMQNPQEPQASYQKAEVSDEVKMISIPAGKFINDDGEEISVSAFKIAQTELTQAQWRKALNDNDFCKGICERLDFEYGIGDNLPIYAVSWFEAVIFCNELSKKEGKTPCYYYGDDKSKTGYKQWENGEIPYVSKYTLEEYKDTIYYGEEKYSWFDIETLYRRVYDKWNNNIKCDFSANGYRLPTKNEFEYATRGGENFAFAGSDSIELVAWSKYNNFDKMQPVGTLRPNGFGLYDMNGNVKEWCWDLDFDFEYLDGIPRFRLDDGYSEFYQNQTGFRVACSIK